MLQDFKDRSTHNISSQTFDPFYDILEKKADAFTFIESPEWRENLHVETDAKDNIIKRVNMEHSI